MRPRPLLLLLLAAPVAADPGVPPELRRLDPLAAAAGLARRLDVPLGDVTLGAGGSTPTRAGEAEARLGVGLGGETSPSRFRSRAGAGARGGDWTLRARPGSPARLFVGQEIPFGGGAAGGGGNPIATSGRTRTRGLTLGTRFTEGMRRDPNARFFQGAPPGRPTGRVRRPPLRGRVELGGSRRRAR